MTRDVWDELIGQMSSLLRLGRLAARRASEQSGIPVAAIGALNLLVMEGPMRLTALADEQSVDPSVASRQVHELVQHGLIARVPDPRDARAALLELTPAGRQMHHDIRRSRADTAAHILRDWTETETCQLVDALARLNCDLRRGTRKGGRAP